MSELILCKQALAARPYFLEGASLNVYSLEELSYYIEKQLWMLDRDFMCEELCDWLEQELKLASAAEKLRSMIESKGTLSEFVLCLLRESGYCSGESLKNIASILQEMDYKSDFERAKLRADRFLKNKKYRLAAGEYRRLLSMEEKNALLVGNVWHNLGTAYAALFLFEEAAECYRRAYLYNENTKSRNARLYALRCMGEEKGFLNAALEYGLSAEKIIELDYHIRMAGKEELERFSCELEEWTAFRKEEEMHAVLEGWTAAYRDS